MVAEFRDGWSGLNEICAVNLVTRIKIKTIDAIWGWWAERGARGFCGRSLWFKAPICFRDFDPAYHHPSVLEQDPWLPDLSHSHGGRIPINLLDNKDSPSPSAQVYAKQTVWGLNLSFHGRFVSQYFSVNITWMVCNNWKTDQLPVNVPC